MLEPKYKLLIEIYDGGWKHLHSVEFRAPNKAIQMAERIAKIGQKDEIVAAVWRGVWPRNNFERRRDYTLYMCEAAYPFRVTIERAD